MPAAPKSTDEQKSEIAEIIRQCIELHANLIINKVVRRNPCPLQAIFTFLDPFPLLKAAILNNSFPSLTPRATA